MKIYSFRGFTLVEALVTMVVMTIVGVSMVTAIGVLTRSQETAQNRSLAVNLLQKSQEEVRRSVYQGQIAFDELGTCQFPQSASSQNLCGFDVLDASLAGFTRTLTVQNQFDSPEVKRVIVDVNFIQLGAPQTLSSVVLLSRPPEPLPGNIIGFASSEEDLDTPIGGVTITATRINSTEVRSTTSSAISVTIGTNEVNFNFSDPSSGTFILSSGQWNITAQHFSYEDYTYPNNPVVIGNQQERFIELTLTPKPQDATIEGEVVNTQTGQIVPSFTNGRIQLFDDGAVVRGVIGQRSFSFPVSFSDNNQRCFTLVTRDAFRAGYAYPTPPGGIAPSCPFLYNRDGYSSAVVGSGGQVSCGNPYNGNATTDRVCVSPGQTLTATIPLDVPNLPVEQVPMVEINGRVVNSQTIPIAGATVTALWPNGDIAAEFRTTDSQGSYRFLVPAVQGMFPNNPANYLRVFARGQVQILDCCNTPRLVTRQSQTERDNIGSLFPGDTRTIPDLIIPTVQDCGNVAGNIRDDFGSFGVSSASVRIYAETVLTVGGGDYIFNCPATGFRLPRGSSRVVVSHPSYYTFDTNGNSQYSSAPAVIINPNLVTAYNAKLWPVGTGTIQGTIRDGGTGNPLGGANVRLRTYSGIIVNATTDGSGFYTFTNVRETWPPVGLPPADPYYRHGTLLHSVEVTHPSGIYAPVTCATPALPRNTTITVDVNLTSQGGL